MTDRERLIEQVAICEEAAENHGGLAYRWAKEACLVPVSVSVLADRAYLEATRAAHHALAARALRDVIELMDEFARRRCRPDEKDAGFSLSEYQATPGL